MGAQQLPDRLLTAFKGLLAAVATAGANVRIERAKLRQYDRGGQTGGQVTLAGRPQVAEVSRN